MRSNRAAAATAPALRQRPRMRPHGGEFLQRRHHVERGGIAVGILALRQCARLLALRAAADEGDEFEQGIRRGRQRHVVGQHLAQRLAPHLGQVRRAEQRDDLVDMAEIVAGENAEGIADDIVEAAARKIELDVPGFLSDPGLFRRRRDRKVAATGLSRDRPGSAVTAGVAASTGPGDAAGASPVPRSASSASARFPCRRGRRD